MIRPPIFSPDELHTIPTQDGWCVALGRYRPRSRPVSREPVILCHGLGANRYNLDLDERYSPARHLARQGFDAWVLELRGRGLVARPSRADANPYFTFDDQVAHDLPEAIGYVRKVTGAARVHWVGHSKGGLLLYAYLSKSPELQEVIAAAVTLGSCGGFSLCHGVRKKLRFFLPLLNHLPVLPTSALRGLAMIRQPPRWLARELANQDNVDPAIGRLACASIVEDLAVGVVRQFLTWIATGSFTSADGKVNYLQGLGRVRSPVLFLAGAADPFAPPEAVAMAHEALGAPEKRMVVAGTAHGFSADYGHGDLSIGRNAPDEIYPLLDGFLAAHSTAPAIHFAMH